MKVSFASLIKPNEEDEEENIPPLSTLHLRKLFYLIKKIVFLYKEIALRVNLITKNLFYELSLISV